MAVNSARDIPSQVLAMLPSLYEFCGPEQFARKVLETAARLVPGDWHGYNEISSTDVVTVITPLPEAMVKGLPAFEQNVQEHPFLSFWKEHENLCPVLSDLTSVGDFHRTTLYNEFYRHFDMEDQLSLARTVGGNVLTVTVSRDRRGFSESDRLAFDLLRPHVLCAHQNMIAARTEAARAAAAGALDDATGLRQATVPLDESGKPVSLGAMATELLEEYFPGGRKRPPGRLPPRVEQWIMRGRNPADRSAMGLVPYQPLEIHGERGRLTVRLIRIAGGRPSLMLTDRPHPADADPRIRSLPPRARRVLWLLLEGLAEKEIANEMALSRHTVHEYVKILYRQLDVSSRSELMASFLKSGG